VVTSETWLPALPESASRARAIVREAASELPLDGEATWDLMLATTEAVANALEHGKPCDPRGIRLRLERQNCGLDVEVGDCGCFSERNGRGKAQGEGGRGMRLIAAVMDRVEVVPEIGMTRVKFAKRVA
jgi:anti-sigma regulatory factor (Ser/Thr protein kinase)